MAKRTDQRLQRNDTALGRLLRARNLTIEEAHDDLRRFAERSGRAADLMRGDSFGRIVRGASCSRRSAALLIAWSGGKLRTDDLIRVEV